MTHPGESKVSVGIKSTLSENVEDPNVKKGEGRFTFLNGDAYDGGYKITRDKQTIVKQDHGVYSTGDFNVYDATWDEDDIVADLHIRYNNGTEYKGSLDTEGAMSGLGTYIFPDGSVLDAMWFRNKPVSDAVLKEPLGFTWKGDCDIKELRFSAGNHFWNEIPVTPHEDVETACTTVDSVQDVPVEMPVSPRSSRKKSTRRKTSLKITEGANAVGN